MAAAEPEGETIPTDLPTSEPEVADIDYGSIFSLVMNATPAAAPMKKPPFFKDAAIHWPTALEAWGAAWPLHIYLSAFAYMALSVWAIIHFIRVLVVRHMPSRPYYAALNFVIVFCCPPRALILLLDPYGTAKILQRWHFGLTGAPFFPSITAAFILVFATLMRVTKMQLVSQRLFSPQTIIFIILLNYSIAFTTDLLAGFYASLAVMLLFCETYFVCWGIVASSAYCYVFRRLYIGTVINRRKLNQIGEGPKTDGAAEGKGGSGSGKDSGKNSGKDLATKMPVAAKITLVAAGSFLSISLLHIWRLSTAVVYSLNGWPQADHWQWFMYKTLIRLAEIFMCGTILYVGTLPFLNKKPK